MKKCSPWLLMLFSSVVILSLIFFFRYFREELIDCSAKVNFYFEDSAFSGDYLLMQDSKASGYVRISGHATVAGKIHEVDRSFRVRFLEAGLHEKIIRLEVIKGTVLSVDDLAHSNSIDTESWAIGNVNQIENISRFIQVKHIDNQPEYQIISTPESPVMICHHR